MGRPARQAQIMASGSRSWGRGQGYGTQGRVYHMTHDDFRATLEVIACMLQLNSLSVYTLIDHSATHSFVSCKILEKLGNNLSKKEKGYTTSTSLGETVTLIITFRSKGYFRRSGNES